MIIDKTVYLDKMENFLNDVHRFENINLKNDGTLSFPFNQEKRVDNIFKKLIVTISISNYRRGSLKTS